MLTTTASYQMITRDLPRSLERTAAEPQVAREREYYLANIGKVKSIDAFIKDDRLFKFAMKAFGLAEMDYAKAFMRKALEEGIDAKDSFANKLTDKRYRDFVETFNFARYGEATTAFDRTQVGTADKYVRATLEEDAGESNEGVRLALYFERKAAGVESVYGLLADPALIKVVQTALRIPAATSAANIDTQAKMIEDRLDIADLKDPKALNAFLNRFTALWELDNPSAATASPAILISQPREAGIGANLLTALQGLRLGGL